jgi:hypothetical protein
LIPEVLLPAVDTIHVRDAALNVKAPATASGVKANKRKGCLYDLSEKAVTRREPAGRFIMLPVGSLSIAFKFGDSVSVFQKSCCQLSLPAISTT